MIETTVHGDPEACSGLAASLRGAQEAVDAAVDAVSDARTQAHDAWQGIAAEAFLAESASFRSELDTLSRRCGDFHATVRTFAGTLQGVQNSFAGIRSDAAGAGLTVTSDGILPPQLAADADDDAVETYNGKVGAYNRLVTRAEDARREEGAAHTRLRSTVQALSADPVVVTILKKLGLVPGELSACGMGTWTAGAIGMTTGWASSWLTRVRFGDFRPRHPAGSPGGIGGRYMARATFAEAPWYRRAVEGARSTNYQPRAYQKLQHDRWNGVGRWVGRAGTVLTVGTSAINQWQQDSDDPSMGTTERVTRSATAGALTGAGAWAGGLAGAQVGAGLGSLVGPVGTVVGGAVGGLIGGALGAGAGDWVADQVIDPVGDLAETAGEVVGNVAGAAGEAVGNLAGAAGEAVGNLAGAAGDAIANAWESVWD